VEGGLLQMGKRLFDIVIGTALALLALPVIVLCALGVALTLQTTPFFVQRRVGRNGQCFLFFKLRTLPTSVPRYADKYALGDVDLPRFTRLLRQLHLDELPQLFLVPLGKMSLVGPRPEMLMLHEQLPESFAGRRTAVRPGCTGLWQIGRHADGLIGEAPVYDQFYLDNQSLKLDLWILARTFGLLTGRDTIIDLRDIPPSVLKKTEIRLSDAHSHSLVGAGRPVASSTLELP
jgi:lipopolysaccharide/colanic/teichoic acid biosynthesis glycosyltransferase